MIKAAKGTKDILPADVGVWQYIEREARDVARVCGYSEIRTPVLEYTELFARGVGEGTDIVEKEMYTFEDRGGRSITLKPEGTAGVVRAFIESTLSGGPMPVKLYYFSPVFRYERPQAGRLREHHQFGLELFGTADASADAEIIWAANEVLLRIGLTQARLLVNSLGCEKCRPRYTEALRAYLKEKSGDLCGTCNDRVERNALRVLDCKVPSCQAVIREAPTITEYLCDDCKAHMRDLEQYLTALGLEYTLTPRLVRGLDYYTRTVFEFVVDQGGAQGGTICGGGRYDHLVGSIGGPEIPAVGMGMGIERLILTLQNAGICAPHNAVPDVFIAVHGGPAERADALSLASILRADGLVTDVDLMDRSLKAQFKYAGKLGVRHVLVIGEKEYSNGTVTMKNMETGEEVVARRERVLSLLR